MAFDDLVDKGRKAYEDNKDKVDGALRSKQAEGISDGVLDGVSGFTKKFADDEQDAKIDAMRAKLDEKVGDE